MLFTTGSYQVQAERDFYIELNNFVSQFNSVYFEMFFLPLRD